MVSTGCFLVFGKITFSLFCAAYVAVLEFGNCRQMGLGSDLINMLNINDRGLKTTFDFEWVIFRIFSANSSMLISEGLPRLIGPIKSSRVFISFINPSIRSST